MRRTFTWTAKIIVVLALVVVGAYYGWDVVQPYLPGLLVETLPEWASSTVDGLIYAKDGTIDFGVSAWTWTGDNIPKVIVGIVGIVILLFRGRTAKQTRLELERLKEKLNGDGSGENGVAAAHARVQTAAIDRVTRQTVHDTLRWARDGGLRDMKVGVRGLEKNFQAASEQLRTAQQLNDEAYTALSAAREDLEVSEREVRDALVVLSPREREAYKGILGAYFPQPAASREGVALLKQAAA